MSVYNIDNAEIIESHLIMDVESFGEIALPITMICEATSESSMTARAIVGNYAFSFWISVETDEETGVSQVVVGEISDPVYVGPYARG